VTKVVYVFLLLGIFGTFEFVNALIYIYKISASFQTEITHGPANKSQMLADW